MHYTYKLKIGHLLNLAQFLYKIERFSYFLDSPKKGGIFYA
ncbi:Uncharacterised protein [Mycoplasmoides pneumoniae]|uniref:Uncharacterized protein n=1 Tax=Mycoplasmoides pneumoniae TaxID=2104 RepID=A0AB38W748_MYCPM|nr:Uncharacterised protein [Mycoplasmoides pneumoniae]